MLDRDRQRCRLEMSGAVGFNGVCNVSAHSDMHCMDDLAEALIAREA